MKKYDFSINVKHGSNIIINHTESDWSALRANSLVSIDRDGHFYTIGRVEPLNFITDFTIENHALVLQGNHEHYFLPGDSITISYKEYELLTIKNIIKKGSNYKIGDTLSLDGGILSVNIVDNRSHPSIFQVEEIDENGGINKLKVIHKGIYINFPDTLNDLTGGNGSGAAILVETNVIKDRKMIERQIEDVKDSGPNTIIELNYRLPKEVTQGKLSMNKYIGYLTSNYIGEDKKNSIYDIVRDFSPVLSLPLLIKGSNKIEETFNYIVLKFEKEIKELKDEISKLKK